MNEAYEDEKLSRNEDGRKNIADDSRSGLPLTTTTDRNIEQLLFLETCHYQNHSKKSPVKSPEDLRPISLLSTIAKNETAVNIHRNLVSVYGEGCMSIQMVRRWRSWFLEGRQNVHDDERSDRPVTATDNAAVAAVRNVVEANRRVTIDEIMIRMPPGIEIGCSSIGTIMSDVLNLN
ncbi:hypothetical protein LAZ67_X002316 [Cordylochernes scorpioides]|uniref:Mos1 transposase HTH domain-containing protein n=1 Tax=Cordylochernes scorpioides TaxID=51811 RepID=A0ABY6LUC8_9ARAC|nr:hypothetical protein LAZ67_X002316 [Cordylochernes scorpioides]